MLKISEIRAAQGTKISNWIKGPIFIGLSFRTKFMRILIALLFLVLFTLCFAEAQVDEVAAQESFAETQMNEDATTQAIYDDAQTEGILHDGEVLSTYQDADTLSTLLDGDM